MDLEYDVKFEEMKKYIPFLESMIKRLESSGSGTTNPRQAQLDKIRSLRDLLMVKKKRMKMENLLKCEQVLVNLYTKVEQRDTLPGIQSASKVISPKEKSDLNMARNKLKTVSSSPHDPDTLPEIARASETEVVCVPGSKEPALFQRRPNKNSVSPCTNNKQSKSPQKSSSKRNYTRVLVSPDRSNRLWSPSDGISPSDQQLFSRRTPPKPSRRYSPSYHKRERKKSSKQDSHTRKSKDFNITLKVPEERLDSLNTKDILSRIINCSDGDVDIATLRELRTQILGELKQTGANEDISDLILKSYKNKRRTNKKDDVEEGELSDSESEAIESIYGNLVVVDKDKNKDTSHKNRSSDRDEIPRKIQICLVINSDKDQNSIEPSNKNDSAKCDVSDFEMFDDNVCTDNIQPASVVKANDAFDKDILSQNTNNLTSPMKVNLNNSQDIITIEDTNPTTIENECKGRDKWVIDMNNFDLQDDSNNLRKIPKSSPKIEPFKANFYKPLFEQTKTSDDSNHEKSVEKSVNIPAVPDESVELDRAESTGASTPNVKSLETSEKIITDKTIDTPITKDNSQRTCENNKKASDHLKIDEQASIKRSMSNSENKDPKPLSNTNNVTKTTNDDILSTEPKVSKDNDKDSEIPFLNEPTVQVAKKDVVSEIDILQALKNEILSETIALPCAEVVTPALHQPKVTKVANVQDLPKKRISIENYKQKSSKPSKTSLFITHPSVLMSKEETRKQSIKLTEKEVERFKIALIDSSDDEEKEAALKSPVVEDLAPKSPDVDLVDDVSVCQPVIIPVDPVKTAVVSAKADVDMRQMPCMSPSIMGVASPNPNNLEPKKPLLADPKRPILPIDPRVRADKDPLLPTPYLNTAVIPPLLPFPNTTPSRTNPAPLMIPNVAPNMTPNRTPCRTPNRPFEMDDSSRKHVYAPMFGAPTQQTSRIWETDRSPVQTPNWEAPVTDRDQNSGRRWDNRDPRNRDEGPRSRFNEPNYDNSYNRPRNDRYSRDDYNRKDGPSNPSYYGRSDCPATPTPSFGRGDAPATPTHYFGRSEGPRTPSHPFGRSEGPMTGNHSFGISEAPLTPSHPFGRSDAPSTPSHPFGRAEAPSTPSHPFGRSNQPSKYGKPQDPRLHRNYDNDTNTRKDQTYSDRFRYSRNDPRNREQSVERCDNRPYISNQNSNRDIRREPSGGQPVHKDYDKIYSRDRSGPDGSRSYTDFGTRRPFQREPSIDRPHPNQHSRAASVGRNCEKDSSNKVSVKWNAGRAFTIDTSVNSTFQKFLDSHRTTDNDTFDARRQRASSVGRSLTRESSVGRNLSYSSSHNNENCDRNKFRRAQSVGRDLSRAQSVGRELKERPRNEKSFKDLKAEFESYRNSDNKFRNAKVIPPKSHDNVSNRDPRCRRDSSDKKLDRPQSSHRIHIKESNMPVKKFNYRDPRQRKEKNLRGNSVHSHGNRNRSDSRDRHSYGISSESVTKNPVINSVKNYKIPKIKRPVEEKPEVEVPKTETKINQTKPVEKEVKKQKTPSLDKQFAKKGKSDKKTVDKNPKKNLSDDYKKLSVESSTKRVTRQSDKRDESLSQSEDDEIFMKTRKYKKVVYHSDSDENTNEAVKTSKTASPKKVSAVKTKTKSNESEQKHKDSKEETENVQDTDKIKQLDENQEALDSSFGLDDMDLFPDSIIADPVLDNINALIADLDNDLDTPKGNATCTDLFSDMNIENMLAKITTSPVKPNTKVFTGSPKTCVENIKRDIFDSLKESELNNVIESNESQSVLEGEKSEDNEIINNAFPSEVTNSDINEERSEISNQPQSEISYQTDDKTDTEAVVSTSVSEEQTSQEASIDIDSGKNLNGRSTPDSTNDAEIMVKDQGRDRLPDSTIEKQSEMNSDISSTLDSGERSSQFNMEAPKDPATQMDSIGSLLSILQDKSKIKELLSMLGGQSNENEKIKKKLEKLSEIVSEDEDSNDGKIEGSENTKSTDVNVENETRTQIKENELIPAEQSSTIEIPPTTNETGESMENETKSAVENESGKMESTETGTETVDNKSTTVTNTKQTEESQEMPEVTSKLQNDKDQEDTIDKKKTKNVVKRFKTGKFKRGKGGKKVFGEEKRVTRSEGVVLQFNQKPTKKPSRELKQLQESIKEMFMSDDILNASGIRMCRLAKMVDDKNFQRKDSERLNESEPVVVLEKVKHVDEKEAKTPEKPLRKKPGPKPKIKPMISPEEKHSDDKKPLKKYKPGPKSKTRLVDNEKHTDPYDFETDSLNESKTSEKAENTSDSESDSVASSKSYGSSDLLVELKKKPKRKRPGWQAGVIKPKHKKRKVEPKRAETPPREPSPEPERKITIPDLHCFTDKRYCFSKNVFRYPCRLCESTHNCSDIVSHYKKHHPHSEIPLSRMSRETAKEAIEQCEEINFQAISKIPTEKYTCRFCFKEFAKKKASLEAFFWHVVSMHTGEYKQLCSECINVTRCPFNLDIPPPPKDIKGQLIGYICGKCNFTQISLENLKMHVIVRHNDEQTEVYTINFAVMTKKTINSLVKRCGTENQPRVTRSSRSNQSLTEVSDDRSDVTESEPEAAHAGKIPDVPAAEKSRNFSFKSKITFENDDNASDISNIAYTESSAVKVEADDEDDNQQDTQFDQVFNEPHTNEPEKDSAEMSGNNRNASISDDIMDYPHFKVGHTDTGNKEYVCCINGKDNHYRTGLLISMKKHVQLKHSENWDGYCFVCKVIVTTQGQHKFTECLQHFLDKHIDNFPVLEKVAEPVPRREAAETAAEASEPPERAPTPKNYINVRPLAELLVKTCEPAVEAPVAFPVIENVVSLLPATVEPPRPSPTYPVTRKEIEPPKEYKYEEAQAEIMSKKHRVVLDAMMAPEKLVQVFKCAGRFCSFTTDSAEDALLHASTHQRVGGTNALLCAYCDFDASGNSIDLVSHVFKNHGRCQYACGLCFYRAAATQLVGAHVARVHGAAPAPEHVLRAHSAPAASDAGEGNMAREVAVPLYVCRQTDREETCSFKTVMHSKFCDHLIQRHDASNGFICYVCSATCADAPSLVLHLKTHGLRVFHCTLCVFGADGELDMLAHASARHPAKPPQAYIRTILGSVSTGGMKILPLVELKKTALSPREVAPSKAKENPVREAERSIELETLIGHITQDEPAAPSRSPAPDSVAPVEKSHDLSHEVEEALSSAVENPELSPMATLMPVPPLAALRPATPATPATLATPSLVSILKQEPRDTTLEKNKSDVICLDSDEEDSKQGIISLSDDDNPTNEEALIPPNEETLVPPNEETLVPPNEEALVSPNEEALVPPKKVPANNLYKCSKCSMTCSTSQGFKKHLSSCYVVRSSEPYVCAHCPYSTMDSDAYFAHYQNAHSAPLPYSCGLCPHKEPTLPRMKLHMKKAHNVNKVSVKSKYRDVGEIAYLVSGTPDAPKPAKPVKRKSSGAAPLTPTKKRYGPSDIDKLPVKPILDESVHCEMCEFNTKVRLNMVRHLQLHAEQQPVPQTAPVNPVPHLQTNEKHFDRMVNLASSSAAARPPPERPAPEPAPLPPALAARYPKYVPERHRHTCGARGCSYISVDEGMLRRHWEALHAGCTDYHCVHCPPYQHLDKSKPLTAARIVAHLKMHDIRLYACSACPYYHYKRTVLDKHAGEHHAAARVLVVREEAAAAPPAPPAPAPAAPTMDLKPWQCGLCGFKSMLRPEVAEHCFKSHNSKMQFKCAYCPFRTSTSENVTKHQSSSHANRVPEIFYFYYREGSIHDDADGTPLWQKQRQKTGLDPAFLVKAELAEAQTSTGAILPQIQPRPAPEEVNLNLVKQEVDPDMELETNESLYKKFGEFCEPNGLNYKCSLCKVTVEDSKEAMQSHLFEELKYRKWGCRLCSYKAFHQTGLKEHMWTEHRQNQEPIELPVDVNVEAWVSQLLNYQEDLIKKNKEKLAQQKIQGERVTAPSTSKTVDVTNTAASKLTVQELEKYFGPLGESSDMMFCCPKCSFKTDDETTMQDHLEAELTKIRWCCSSCPNHFTTYHSAQFHCKSVHAGQAARPVEAARDPAVRAAWVAAALRAQAVAAPARAPASASLLVERYAEPVPTPEEETLRRAAADGDDDAGLAADGPGAPGDRAAAADCPYCEFKTKYPKIMRCHVLRHYNLKPYTCPYCHFDGFKPAVLQHIAADHPEHRAFAVSTAKPAWPPTVLELSKQPKKPVPTKKSADDDLVCLTCEDVLGEAESRTHVHEKIIPRFAKKGAVVVKCCDCLLLLPDVIAMQRHYTDFHTDLPINYAYYKLLQDTRDVMLCYHCNQRFSHLIDLKSHHKATHGQMRLKYSTIPYIPGANEMPLDPMQNLKRKSDTIISPPKRCAKKSTTKLPHSQAVAKKSTSKLPFFVDSDSESEDEYSYYGTKPTSWDELSNVTTMMPFCNTMVPFTLQKLSEIIKLNPKVVVKDCKK